MAAVWHLVGVADDEFLRLLGEITVEASAVEYCVAYLVTLARGLDKSEVVSILNRVGGARQQLLKLCEETSAARGKKDLHDRLVALEHRMSKALWERNRLVHAVEVLRLAEDLSPAELAMWHPKTDTSLSVSKADMNQLANELRAVAGTALRM